MLRIGFDDAISETHALEGRTLYLCYVEGGWRLSDQALQPVASFVPSGERATLIPLERSCRVYLNRQALTAGVSYDLFAGDRLEVQGVQLRIGGDGPRRTSRAWLHGLALFGLFGGVAWALFAYRAALAPPPEPPPAAPSAPAPTVAPQEDPGARLERERTLARRAIEEAVGLERVQAFARAAQVLQQAAERVEDPQLQSELSRRRSELLARATAAPVDSRTPAGPLAEPPAEPAAAVEDATPLEVEAPDPAPPPRVVRKVEADPFLLEVDAAIEAGARHLTTEPYGPTRPGEAALVAFALLRSGVPPTDPTVVAMLAHLDGVMDTTYDLAVAIMALEARSIVRVRLAPLPGATTVARFQRQTPGQADRDRIAGWAQQLIAGQGPHGDWGYPCPPLAGTGTGEAPRRSPPSTDDSNTQFAVLALHAAARAGVAIPDAVWRRVLTHYLETATAPTPVAEAATCELDLYAPGFLREAAPGEAQGRGWPYKASVERAKPTLSMTAAGLSSLVIAADALVEAGALTPEEQAAAGALALAAARFLADRFPRRGVPRESWQFYWLYGLEKAMEVSGIERLAERDWYRAAAGYVLKMQRQDGSWGPEIQSSLALLVLNRATLRLHEGTRVRGGGAAPAAPPLRVEVGGDEVDLPARLAALSTLERPRKEHTTLRAALRKLPEAERPRLVAALAALLACEEASTRRFAERELEAITGEELDVEGYRTWGRLYGALAGAQALDEATAAAAREALARDGGGPLIRAATTAATRCQALALIPDLVDALWRVEGEDHAAVCAALRALGGADPASGIAATAEQSAAWRGWLRDERPALDRRVWVHTFVTAAPGAVEARGRLAALDPEQVVPELLRAYAGAPDATWVPPLLLELTGLEAEPTPAGWSAAWEARPR
ncbi:MAG: hypothetical protein R3F62_25390 [Planctomycetota bacterium]